MNHELEFVTLVLANISPKQSVLCVLFFLIFLFSQVCRLKFCILKSLKMYLTKIKVNWKHEVKVLRGIMGDFIIASMRYNILDISVYKISHWKY